MIIVAGLGTEQPVRLALDAAREQGIDAVLLDERTAGQWLVDLRIDDAGVSGAVTNHHRSVDLDEVNGVYLRLLGLHTTTPRRTPDPADQARRLGATGLLTHWAQNTPARVANRPEAMASNASKPYQAALIAQAGFSVPEILVTNDAAAARAFVAEHGRVVFKSTSGIRSIVHELAGERLATLERIGFLPTQFQVLVTGTNVRVHVVGTEVFACAVRSTSIDYRYTDLGGQPTSLTRVDIPADVATACVALSKSLDLPLAGIDLMRDDEDQWWCFEVNPSPAYSCFQEPTGLPMAQALVRWLEQGPNQESR